MIKSLVKRFQVLGYEVRKRAAVYMHIAQGKHIQPALFHKGTPECELRSEATQFVRRGEEVFFFALHFNVQLIEVLEDVSQIREFYAPLLICEQLCICRFLFCQEESEFFS